MKLIESLNETALASALGKMWRALGDKDADKCASALGIVTDMGEINRQEMKRGNTMALAMRWCPLGGHWHADMELFSIAELENTPLSADIKPLHVIRGVGDDTFTAMEDLALEFGAWVVDGKRIGKDALTRGPAGDLLRQVQMMKLVERIFGADK